MLNLFSLPQFGHTRIVVWYQTADTFRSVAGLGVVRAQESGRIELALGKSHKAICEFFIEEHKASKVLENVYTWMQGEIWSPNAEGAETILNAGVSHTSMSAGDIVQVGDKFFACEMVGFEDITQTVLTLVPDEMQPIIGNGHVKALYNDTSAKRLRNDDKK